MMIQKKFTVLTFFAHMINDGVEFVLPVLLPIIAMDFQLSYSQIGFLGGSMIIAIGFGQIFMGYLSDLVGKRKVFVSLGLILLAVGFSGISFSTSYLGLVLFNFVAGLGASVYHPVGISSISEIFQGNRKGRALGIHGAGGNLGMCLFPLFAGVFADFFGWRTIFQVIPFFAVLVSVFFYLFIDEPFKKRVSFNFSIIVNSKLVLIALSLGFVMMMARGMAVFFPVRLDSIGVSSSIIGVLFALFFGAGVFGQYIGGFYSDTYPKKRMIMGLSVVTGILLSLLFVTTSFVIIVCLLLVAGFLKDSVWPPLFGLFTDYASLNFYGTSLGIFFSIGCIMGSQGSVLMGLAWDYVSFAVAVALLLIFGIAAVVTVKKI